MTKGKHEEPAHYWVSVSKNYLTAAGLQYLLDNCELEEFGTDDSVVVAAAEIETALGSFLRIKLYPDFLKGKWAELYVPMQYVLSITHLEDADAMKAGKLGFVASRRNTKLARN